MAQTRNPERTRQAILKSAGEELAQFGVAGARVDRIAAAAGVNKRMIYHYFGSKDGLCEAVFRHVLAPLESALAATSLEDLPGALEDLSNSEAWRRIAAWEAVSERPVDADERRRAWDAVLAVIDAAQAGERLPPDLDTRQLLLALLGLAVFPKVFPQYAQMITGAEVRSEEFTRAHRVFQNRLMRLLGRAAAREPGKPRVRIKRTDRPPQRPTERR